MIKNFRGKCKYILKDIVLKLKGADKRITLAHIAKEHGRGGQTLVAREFEVGRDTIRKGLHELNSVIKCKDALNMRGRKKITVKLPNLEEDLKNTIDSQSQIDPKFQSTRLYTRLTIVEIRKQLIDQKAYKDAVLPTYQPNFKYPSK